MNNLQCAKPSNQRLRDFSFSRQQQQGSGLNLGAGLLAAVMIWLSPMAFAQETPEQAIARLDAIIETLEQARASTARLETLEASLENSVSRFTCTRFWALGMLVATLGASGETSLKAETAFKLPTPVGWIQTYVADNGAPLYAGLGGKISNGISLDSYSGPQYWQCWSVDLPFSPPDPYDIGDFEYPLSSTALSEREEHIAYQSQDPMSFAVRMLIRNAHAQYLAGAVDPGFEQAVLLLNSLAATIRELGLDPSNPAVVTRLLTDGGVSAMSDFRDLFEPGMRLPERAAHAPDRLFSFLDRYGPGQLVTDGVEAMLSINWMEQGGSCTLLPRLTEACLKVHEYSDHLLDVIMTLEQTPEWISTGFDSIISMATEIHDAVLVRVGVLKSGVFDPAYDGIGGTYNKLRGALGGVNGGAQAFGNRVRDAVHHTFQAYTESNDLFYKVWNAYLNDWSISTYRAFGMIVCTFSVNMNPSTLHTNPPSVFFHCYT